MGAIQALPTAQIGQRGQSVGRSQGQIRVAHRKRGGPSGGRPIGC